jgi:hypothetical protein
MSDASDFEEPRSAGTAPAQASKKRAKKSQPTSTGKKARKAAGKKADSEKRDYKIAGTPSKLGGVIGSTRTRRTQQTGSLNVRQLF